MKQEHIGRIKGYYDKAGEFKQNDRYLGEQGTVYTKDGGREAKRGRNGFV